jgi:hypothetical protein
MAKSLAGTRTEKHPTQAFADESMGRNHSTDPIVAETADTQKAHPRTFLKPLAGANPSMQVQLGIPLLTFGKTVRLGQYAKIEN